MNYFGMSDLELSVALDDCRKEVRRRQLASAPGMDALSVIHGNELAKRALLVAAAGHHSILFIGGPNVGKTMFCAAAKALGVEAFEYRPCPCGCSGRPVHSCSCNKEEIEKYLTFAPKAEITVEVCQPTEREFGGHCLGTSMSDLRKQLSCASSYDLHGVDEDGRALLKAAVVELGMDSWQRDTIIRIGRSVANLAQSTVIKSFHLCEAVNYVSYLRRF